VAAELVKVQVSLVHYAHLLLQCEAGLQDIDDYVLTSAMYPRTSSTFHW